MIINNIHAAAASTPANTTGTDSSTSSGTGGAASAASGTTLGGTDFLTLMLAQLKNQDPTSPVDSNTF
ncbi:MAG TPA: flagellar hook capping FlgD N-terminal domain-containing protein, partial [Steroidobacteraceae bacterium]|nr:flagellar hook capping FlgD N-terminal domain-containing protein [Steroidobacteraceae bacterium]